MWGHKPDMSHLRVFGSVCYPLVVPASRRVQNNALKYPSSCGIFLGYAENCPGAVILDPTYNTLSVRRDVVVDENWRFHGMGSDHVTLRHTNPALQMVQHAPTGLVPISDSQHIPLAHKQHHTASTYIVDVCAGSSSALRYHLLNDPNAMVMAIDILPFEKVICHIPAEHRHRFTYVRVSMADLNMAALQKIVYDHWSIPIDKIDQLHGSHPCETYSDAHHGNNFHRIYLTPLTSKAIEHYRMLHTMTSLLSELAARNPRILITA